MAYTAKFRPYLVDALKHYSPEMLVADMFAGITVAVIALPLATAFAIASGLRPEAGIFTSIIAGFMISALGGSRVQIGGPAGAFIVIVYGIVQQYGEANLLVATMFAGVLLFLMGLFKIGTLIRHIPVSIVIGFTNGIAVLIALSQIKDFLGLPLKSVPAEFFAQVHTLALHIHETNLQSLGLGLACLAGILLWPKTYKHYRWPVLQVMARVPGTIIAVVIGMVAVKVFHLDVATIGSRFGGIPQGLPEFDLPGFDWDSVRHLMSPAITIALLSAIESLLCARVADSIIGDRHNPSQELMGQGLANIVAPLFGGFCATGTIARTVANIRSGAVSPISGMVHSGMLLLIILVAAPWAKDVPLASLSAILLFVAYNMGEWKQFLEMRHFTLNYRVILLSAFILTVVVDLTMAVEAGLVLASLFFITRVASLTFLEPVESETPGLRIYRLHGSLFFGSVSKIEGLLDPKADFPRWLLLDFSPLLNLDTTGLEALKEIADLLEKHEGELLICGSHSQVDSLIHRSGFAEHLGESHLFPDMETARAWVAAQ